ncbi:aminoglycoside phosphotransferase [Halococcus hamelinensis 100A6]|uniref:Aminoglycoside phosphotransferase n=2 Tax=Halococcus hamelinensis TaxID=332168 RepID=M0LX30_9EURY|nr:aminoglycoside phosphotransferase [Halococcus hamelinensis 100A6]
MVQLLQPSWSVEAVTRAANGTDFVASVDVQTPDGPITTVLKATTADHVSSETALAEPCILEFIGRETSIPVPTVFGYGDDHDEYPTPFYLMSHVEGENYEGRIRDLPKTARMEIFREAGQNLAELHTLGPLPKSGRIGVVDGELAILDTDEFPSYESFHGRLLASYEDNLDSLASGGHFVDLADDKTRFADLVPPLRQYLQETIPELPTPESSTYSHEDYRYGNLLVEPTTGRTQAVLDWGIFSSAPPAYNLANTESLLLTPDVDSSERTNELRQTLRRSYAERRPEWSFDDATLKQMEVYRLTCRIDAMACLPLWHQDATPSERDERAAEHRDFVHQYL